MYHSIRCIAASIWSLSCFCLAELAPAGTHLSVHLSDHFLSEQCKLVRQGSKTHSFVQGPQGTSALPRTVVQCQCLQAQLETYSHCSMMLCSFANDADWQALTQKTHAGSAATPACSHRMGWSLPCSPHRIYIILFLLHHPICMLHMQ